MDKTSLINQLIEIQLQLAQVLLPYAVDSWRHLDIPVAQLKSLFIIACKDGANFRTLASYLGTTPGNVTGIIDRLVEQNLVMRHPGMEDRRVTRLEVTEKGRELLANLIEVHNRYMVHILEHMSLENLQALSRGITGFTKAVLEHQKEFSEEPKVKGGNSNQIQKLKLKRQN